MFVSGILPPVFHNLLQIKDTNVLGGTNINKTYSGNLIPVEKYTHEKKSDAKMQITLLV